MNLGNEAISNEQFRNIIDNLHDEVMIYDNNYQLVYVNNAAFRHYGKNPDELIGMDFSELDEVFWGNSTLAEAYRTKSIVAKRQITNIGKEVVTISVPIFDDNNELIYVAQNVNDIVTINDVTKLEKHGIDIMKSKSSKYIYKSSKIEKIMELIMKIKNVKNPCLILGETGTGKSLLAQYMHEQSDRRDKAFICVNCACMNPNLLESELFGYKKGAFSGANNSGKKGIVEIANGGTLFLDEISELPYKLQGKILQFIQTQEYMPLGSEKVHKVDVKIICATNRDLSEMVEMGTFRKDLYYRLNLFELMIPPLRERREDIRPLIEHFMKIYNHKYMRNLTISDEAYKYLINYYWNGNIRELSHVIEKLVVLEQGREIRVSDLPEDFFSINSENNRREVDKFKGKTLNEAVEYVEREIVTESYNRHKNSVRVAEELGISQPKAYRLIKKYVLANKE